VQAFRVKPDDGSDVYRHYMFIWKLFYLEFAVFCLASLLPAWAA
jgi:hypothetical protein